MMKISDVLFVMNLFNLILYGGKGWWIPFSSSYYMYYRVFLKRITFKINLLHWVNLQFMKSFWSYFFLVDSIMLCTCCLTILRFKETSRWHREVKFGVYPNLTLTKRFQPLKKGLNLGHHPKHQFKVIFIAIWNVEILYTS